MCCDVARLCVSAVSAHVLVRQVYDMISERCAGFAAAFNNGDAATLSMFFTSVRLSHRLASSSQSFSLACQPYSLSWLVSPPGRVADSVERQGIDL